MRIVLTHHAVEQYHARVKPAMLRTDAHLELEALAEQAEVVHKRPSWITSRRPTLAWAVISDGVALALCKSRGRWVATTCLIRDGRESAERRRRTAREALRYAERLAA